MIDTKGFFSDLPGLSQNTVACYKNALRVFDSMSIPVDEKCLAVFSKELRKEYSKSTRMLYTAALKRYITWLSINGGMSKDTYQSAISHLSIDSVSTKRSQTVVRTPDPTLYTIVEYYDNPSKPNEEPREHIERLRNRALLHLLWDSGGRISEILSLNRKVIADGEFDMPTITGKGDKRRELFLSEYSLRAVREYCELRDDKYPALFVSFRRDVGHRLSRVAAWGIVNRAKKACGIKGMCSPHMFRHARAESLVNNGMLMEHLQVFLGHENIATTQTFYGKIRRDVVKSKLKEFGLTPEQIKE